MKDDDVERRAKALAGVIVRYFPETGLGDNAGKDQPIFDGSVALERAYWIVWALRDPAGERGLWNVGQQEQLFKDAIMALRNADKALRQLASPIQIAVSRRIKINRGLAIPPTAAKVLAERRVRLKPLPDSVIPVSEEAEVIKDAGDPTKEVSICIGTVPHTAPVLVGEIRKALDDIRTKAKKKVREVIAQGQSPGHRNWDAHAAYQQLEDLWAEFDGKRPPLYPKPTKPGPKRRFRDFAMESFVALEIPHDVRSTMLSIRKLEKKSRAKWSKLREK